MRRGEFVLAWFVEVENSAEDEGVVVVDVNRVCADEGSLLCEFLLISFVSYLWPR